MYYIIKKSWITKLESNTWCNTLVRLRTYRFSNGTSPTNTAGIAALKLKIEQPLSIVLHYQKEKFRPSISYRYLSFNSYILRKMSLTENDIIKKLRNIQTNDALRQFLMSALFPYGSKILPDPKELSLYTACAWQVGKSYLEQKKYQRAVLFLKWAVSLSGMLKNKINRKNIMYDLGFAYLGLGQLEETINCWKEVWNLSQQLSDWEYSEEIASYLANVYRRLNRFREAIEFDKIALNFHQDQLEATTDTNQKIVLNDKLGYDLNYLGLDYSYIGPVEKAISNYLLSVHSAEEMNNIRQKINRTGNLARLYAISGQKEEALRLFLNILEEIKESDPSNFDAEMKTNMSLGNVYRELGRPCDAEIYYQTALKLAKQAGDRENENRLLNSLGIIYRDLDELDSALKYYLDGLQIAKEAGDEIGEGDALGNIGNLFYQIDKPKEAEPYYQKALKISENFHDTTFISRWTGNLANVYNLLGNTKKAISYYEKGLDLAKSIHDKDHEYLWNYNLGSIFQRQLKDLNRAYDFYHAAIKCLQELRREVKRDDFSRSFGESKVFVYQDMVNTCLKLPDRKQEAIGFVEQGKGYTLTRMMAEANLKPSSKVPQQLVKTYNDLLARQRFLEKRLTESLTTKLSEIEKSEEQNESFKSKILAAETVEKGQILKNLIEARKLQDENFKAIAKYDPVFIDIFNPPMITIDEIQTQLAMYDKKTALVEFFITGDQTNVFIIAQNDWLVVEIPEFKEKSLNTLIQNRWIEPYQQYLDTGILQLWLDAIVDIGNFLYKELWYYIQDVLDQLQVKKLILILHAGLHILPLHLIPLRKENHNESINYLINRYEISYAPNFRMLKICHNEDRIDRAKEQFFAISNPDCSLPFAEIEVINILNWFTNSKILWHHNATKEHIKSDLEFYNIIHFATHGKGATLDLFDAHLKTADKKLYINDIFNDIEIPNAYTVILSACETSLIKLDRGDEYFGLPAAFLYAGAPTVIGSLWISPDVSTALLMSRWYENIFKRKMNRAESLKESQQWLQYLQTETLREFLNEILKALEAKNYSSGSLKEKAKDGSESVFISKEVFKYLESLSKQHRRKLLNNVKKTLKLYEKLPPDTCPFEHPFFWGGFIVTGNSE